jgi:hypothetical protein
MSLEPSTSSSKFEPVSTTTSLSEAGPLDLLPESFFLPPALPLEDELDEAPPLPDCLFLTSDPTLSRP